MLYQYTTNRADFTAAQALMRRINQRARLKSIFWYRVMPVVAMVSAVLLVRDIAFHHFSYPAWLGGLLAGLVYLGIFPTVFLPFQMRSLYKRMKNGQPDDRPLELEINETELISRVAGVSEGRFLRPGVKEFHEDDRTAVLLVAKKVFLMLPKRTLPEDAFIEVRKWMGKTVD